MYQERLKVKDYEAQSTLVTWDRALERHLQKLRAEEMELECANITNGGNANFHGQPMGNTLVTVGNH